MICILTERKGRRRKERKKRRQEEIWLNEKVSPTWTSPQCQVLISNVWKTTYYYLKIIMLKTHHAICLPNPTSLPKFPCLFVALPLSLTLSPVLQPLLCLPGLCLTIIQLLRPIDSASNMSHSPLFFNVYSQWPWFSL